MSDFLLTLFKGLYPLYLFFVGAGILIRLRQRRWSGFDSLLAVSFLIFEVLAAFQIFLFYGEFTTSKRYLWVALPLVLPFAAEGVLAGMRKGVPKWISLLVFLILVGGNLYNTYSPVIRERFLLKKRQERELSREVALWLRNDWKGAPAEKVRVFCGEEYHSGKRPLVLSSLGRVGWLCGGESYPAFFAFRILPDYIILQEKASPANYSLAKILPPVYIYRKTGVRHELSLSADPCPRSFSAVSASLSADGTSLRPAERDARFLPGQETGAE